jgi:hypothetical protein
MGAMLRHLFTLLSAVSLLLCMGVCVLWARSYQTADCLRSYRPDPATARWASDSLCSTKGRLVLSQTRVEFESPEHAEQYAKEIFATPNSRLGLSHIATEAYWYPPSHPTFWERIGFRSVPYDGARSHVERRREQAEFYAPHWAAALTTALPPAIWLRRHRARRNRRRRGLCIGCGYDLRATPDRCPECGAVPTAKPA